MRRKLFEIGGIAHLDMNLLLDAKQNDEGQEEFIRARVICGRNQSLLHTKFQLTHYHTIPTLNDLDREAH